MLKRVYISTLLLLISFQLSFGQKENLIWHFGFNASLDFTSGIPIPIEGSEIFSKEGCASISDSLGQLLFYTNGLEVWNKNHTLIPNGTGLLGGAATSSTNQALIVPIPNQPSQYYIFTADERANGNGIHYSKIDLTLNNGLGGIIEKNKVLYQPSTERLTLARHSNGVDYWLITHPWNSNEFWTFLINKNGIDTQPIVSQIGNIHAPVGNNNLDSRGMMTISADGTQLAVVMYTSSLIDYFQFDPCSGALTNQKTIYSIPYPYGLAFSPNSKWLYISNLEGDLYQYDLENEREQKIGETQGNHLGAIQLAPDGKMYVAITNSSQIGVIQHPNEYGLASNYQDLAIDLGNGVCAEGLPPMLPKVSDIATNQNIDAIISTNHNCQDDPIAFSIISEETITNATWKFKSNTSTDLTATFTTRDTGSYPISVIVSNDCKIDTLLDTVHIEACELPIFIPNAFSPNHDGQNDLFKVYGDLNLIDEYEMAIFSRWGDQLFFTKSPNEGWDGTARGKTLGDGVYVWMIKVKYSGIPATKVLSGDVTLMR